MSDDYERGCAETASGIRMEVDSIIQYRLDELEIQQREVKTAIANLSQMKKLIASSLESE
tara:strand:- start:43 stop:222 length:180 start_codon:yes stop_codon:yes gene_type:complete